MNKDHEINSCENCGSEILDDNAKFCPKCGTSISIEKEESKGGFLDKILDDENVQKFKNSVEGGVEKVKTKYEEEQERSKIKKEEKMKQERIELRKKQERETILIEKKEAKKAFFTAKSDEYVLDAKLADKVYKAYITDGLSRIDKVNGRFLASQTIKMDVLIEQNNEIIRVLKKIAGDEQMDRVCSDCGATISNKSKFCNNCGNQIG